jgi:hypothetical protein
VDAGGDQDGALEDAGAADAAHDGAVEGDGSDDAGLDGDGGPEVDGGEERSDAGAGDAGDASTEGGTQQEADAGATSSTAPDGECLYLDDIDVALLGLHPRDVWVTRLRASLPADALGAGDLRLEAAKDQTTVSNVHYAPSYADEDSAGEGSRDACVSAPKRHTAFGSWAVATLSAIAGLALLRRRTRR